MKYIEYGKFKTEKGEGLLILIDKDPFDIKELNNIVGDEEYVIFGSKYYGSSALIFNVNDMFKKNIDNELGSRYKNNGHTINKSTFNIVDDEPENYVLVAYDSDNFDDSTVSIKQALESYVENKHHNFLKYFYYDDCHDEKIQLLINPKISLIKEKYDPNKHNVDVLLYGRDESYHNLKKQFNYKDLDLVDYIHKNCDLESQNMIIWAIEQHKLCNQKYDGKPYRHHLNMVAKELLNSGYQSNDNSELVAAYCHDLIEDARQTYNDVLEKTNLKVAEITYALTNEKGKTRKERANDKYYQGIRETQGAVIVKLCDRLANMRYSLRNSNSDGMINKYIGELDEFLEKLGVYEEGDKYQYFIDEFEKIKKYNDSK